MKSYAAAIIIAAIFYLLAPLPLCAAIEVKVGIYQNEPLIFMDDTGTAKGVFADVLEHIAQREGWTIRYLTGSFQQGLERLKTGEIDLLCTIAYLEERDKWFDFTEEFEQRAIIFNTIRFHYAVPEGKNQHLLAATDRFITSLKDDEGSVYNLSLEKWFGVASGRKTFPSWVRWAVTAIGGIILLLIMGNVILRCKVREKTEAIQQELADCKKAEAALREREAQYRDLFENANELIQSVSCDGHFLRVNKKWKDTLGYSEEEIAHMSIWEIVDPATAPHCQEVFSKLFCGEHVDVIETTFIAKDGTAIPVEGTASCRLLDGKPVSTRSIFRDIREKKRNEEEKNKLKSQLGRVQKLEAIGTLAGGVAHDFNNLLMTIQGNVSLMLLDIDPSNPHHKTLNDIENAVKSGAKLTRQLLGYARKGNYNVRPLNLNQIVKETSETFGRTRKEIAINLELEEDAHPISEKINEILDG